MEQDKQIWQDMKAKTRFSHAFHGLYVFYKTTRNLKIHLLISAAVLILGFYLKNEDINPVGKADLKVVVIDGDGNALMGLSSWSLMPLPNLTYYVLQNRMYETTGGQAVPELPFVPEWCNVVEIAPGKEETPNPPSPVSIWRTCQSWLLYRRAL